MAGGHFSLAGVLQASPTVKLKWLQASKTADPAEKRSPLGLFWAAWLFCGTAQWSPQKPSLYFPRYLAAAGLLRSKASVGRQFQLPSLGFPRCPKAVGYLGRLIPRGEQGREVMGAFKSSPSSLPFQLPSCFQ